MLFRSYVYYNSKANPIILTSSIEADFMPAVSEAKP